MCMYSYKIIHLIISNYPLTMFKLPLVLAICGVIHVSKMKTNEVLALYLWFILLIIQLLYFKREQSTTS